MTRKSFYTQKLKRLTDLDNLTESQWLELAEARTKETGKLAGKKATQEFGMHLLEHMRAQEKFKRAAIRYHKRAIMKDFEQLTKESNS